MPSQENPGEPLSPKTAEPEKRTAGLYREIVEAAVLSMRGERALATRLGVELGLVRRWRTGEEEPVLEEFLELLEVVTEAPWRTGGPTDPAEGQP